MFGGWSITESLFKKILDLVPDGGTILELGSGEATAELLKHYHVYSVEHNKNYLDKYSTNYIYAPLKLHDPVEHYILESYGEASKPEWYDPEILKAELPRDYDLLLIDGPPMTRSGTVKFFDLFRKDIPIILDDHHRTLERRVMHDISKLLGKPYTVYDAWECHAYAIIGGL